MSFFVAFFSVIEYNKFKIKNGGKDEKTFDDSWDFKKRKNNDL